MIEDYRQWFFKILRPDPNNILENINYTDSVDYGKVKHCKRCGKKLNYINAKKSKFCHACKTKVLRDYDKNATSRDNQSTRSIIESYEVDEL